MMREKDNKYLILIKDIFVRDLQIAEDQYIQDYSKDKEIDTADYNWDDFEGEISLGIFFNKNLEFAIKEAAEVYSIDKFALKGYKLV